MNLFGLGSQSYLVLIVWIICALGAFAIAQSKGAKNLTSWFLVGFLFGPIGLLLAVIGAKPPGPVGGTPVVWPGSPPATPPAATGFCPRCGTPRAADARFCPKCGLDLTTS